VFWGAHVAGLKKGRGWLEAVVAGSPYNPFLNKVLLAALWLASYSVIVSMRKMFASSPTGIPFIAKHMALHVHSFCSILLLGNVQVSPPLLCPPSIALSEHGHVQSEGHHSSSSSFGQAVATLAIGQTSVLSPKLAGAGVTWSHPGHPVPHP
jgi:hypothetical protein